MLGNVYNALKNTHEVDEARLRDPSLAIWLIALPVLGRSLQGPIKEERKKRRGRGAAHGRNRFCDIQVYISKR